MTAPMEDDDVLKNNSTRVRAQCSDFVDSVQTSMPELPTQYSRLGYPRAVHIPGIHKRNNARPNLRQVSVWKPAIRRLGGYEDLIHMSDQSFPSGIM